MTAAARKSVPRVSALEVFIARAEARATLWAASELSLHDAVDELQRAAEADGFVAELGQDEVQRLMVEAFAPLRDEEPAEKGDVITISDDDTFADACHAADEKQWRKPRDPHVERLRAVMNDDVSLERAWHELNRRPPGDVPIATLQAAEFLVREGDRERFKCWLEKKSEEERAAILQYLFRGIKGTQP